MAEFIPGGSISNQRFFLVGEKGPELFVIPEGGVVESYEDTLKRLSDEEDV